MTTSRALFALSEEKKRKAHDVKPTLSATGRKLTLVALGLAALITTVLCAFALPSLSSGSNRVPIGVTGPEEATTSFRQSAGGDAWDIRLYPTTAPFHNAVKGQANVRGLSRAAGTHRRGRDRLGEQHLVAGVADVGGNVAGVPVPEGRAFSPVPDGWTLARMCTALMARPTRRDKG